MTDVWCNQRLGILQTHRKNSEVSQSDKIHHTKSEVSNLFYTTDRLQAERGGWVYGVFLKQV